MNTIELIDKRRCTGCSLCYNICPKNAITLAPNEEGFLFPNINHDKCIDCGICFNKCPITISKGNELFSNKLLECDAYQADNSTRLLSSSGGAFSTIATYFIEKGGYVCGAAYNRLYTNVEHIIINSLDKLDLLRRSKYYQSNISHIYKPLKQLLSEDKYVLFVGTPCECAALKSYLGKDYHKLLIVDIVCHGVPSNKVFNKFLDSLNFCSHPIEINFRQKSGFGWTPTMDIKFQNGKHYYKPKWECSYYEPFLKGYGDRESCGNCEFNRLPRQGDLTFCDAWGVERLTDLKDNIGTSLILFNNTKAMSYKNVFNSNCKAFITQNIYDYYNDNINIFESSKTNYKLRKRFFTLLNKYSFTETMNRIKYRHFEIGVVGWWYGNNYGSALTYYALNRVLYDLGFDPLMLEWPFDNKVTSIPTSKTREVFSKYYEYSYPRTMKEYPELNQYVDIFMVGSDQLWNYWDQGNLGYYYFLDFVDDKHPRISYSTSFGHASYEAPYEQVTRQSEELHKFSAISVREDAGVDICKNIMNVNAAKTLDPVFLANLEDYNELIKNETKPCATPYLFCYILSPTKKKGILLKQIAKKLNLELVVCLDGQSSLEKNKKKLGIDYILTDVSASRWLKCIVAADYIITDSYHGTCFSIIYKKQFVCMINEQRGASRFETLLSELNLKSRGLYDISQILNFNFNDLIVYDDVNVLLQKEIDYSKDWLETSLNNALKERQLRNK